MVPLLNAFVVMYGFVALDSMQPMYLKEHGASDFEIALVFLLYGFMTILGNVITAKVRLVGYGSFFLIC